MNRERHRICVMDMWEPVNADKESVYIAFSYANDLAKGQSKHDVKSKPMLEYRSISLSNGKQVENYHVLYDKSDWDRLKKVLNTEGDKPVFNGAVYTDKNGQQRVDIDSAERTEIPFSAKQHKQKTLKEREYQVRLFQQQLEKMREIKESDREL